ncbi:MAG: hypothetical protein GF329_05065 [Candidatus Lokiarchaeota archaeon]|nr:hypothetical protein [Candidatus Lokiarchaeota archaeon]
MLVKKYIIEAKSLPSPLYIKEISVSNDSKYLITSHWDNKIEIFDIQTSRSIRVLEGHSDSVYSAEFSSKNKYVASSSFDKTVRLWDFNTGKCIRIFKDHDSCVNSVIFGPDEDHLISGSRDRKINYWNIHVNKPVKTIKAHHGSIETLAISPDGKKIISGSTDRSIKIWTFPEGINILHLPDLGSIIQTLRIAPDGKRLFSNNKEDIQIWNIKKGDLIHTFEGNKGNIISLSISKDGKNLISGSEEGNIIIWDLKSKKIITDHQINSEIVDVEIIPYTNSSNHLIDLSFLHVDKDGNIVQWLLFNEEKISGNEIFDKIDEQDFTLLLSNLTHSRVSSEIVSNDFNIDQEIVIRFIKELKQNKIIDGYFDENLNFLSYLEIENAINEVLNLSGRIKISQISRSIGLDESKILKIMEKMQKENKIQGILDINKSLFIAHEQLMSEILTEIERNKIINYDHVYKLFSTSIKDFKAILEDLITRGALKNIKIGKECIKCKDYKADETIPLKPQEISEEINEVPEEIMPEEITPQEIIDEPKEIQEDSKEIVYKVSSKTIQDGTKKRSKIDDYIRRVDTTIGKLSKICEILEIPAFYEETELFFEEVFEILEKSLSKLSCDVFRNRLYDLKDKINKIKIKEQSISLKQLHNLEYKLIRIIQDFIDHTNDEIKDFIQILEEFDQKDHLKKAFIEFRNKLTKLRRRYIEDTLDSFLLLRNDESLFYYRLRPIYHENVNKIALNIIKNSDGASINDKYDILKYSNEFFNIYVKEKDSHKVILITTGECFPKNINSLNNFATEILSIDNELQKQDKERIKKLIKKSFNLHI